jgi:HD superfamily phosphohydrolase
MLIKDTLYGSSKITDELAIAIIKSSPFQRLKGVSQWGYTRPFYGETKVNRFDHSVGVYLLLAKYGTPREEQIAGLIHDVSHSAFSHTIDFLVKESSGEKMAHQDNIFADFVRKSEIPNIISKFGLNLAELLDDNNFPLKEKPQPDLCADRIDYLLRDALALKEIDKDDVNEFMHYLIIENNNWAFISLKFALKFAKLMQLMNKKYYANFCRGAVMHHLTAEYLHLALDKKYINMENIYSNDKHVLEVIKKYHKFDTEINSKFADMNNPQLFENKKVEGSIKVAIKSRVIDPLIFSNNKLSKLSNHNKAWKKTITQDLKPVTYFLHRKTTS